jgi:hypothetical protein
MSPMWKTYKKVLQIIILRRYYGIFIQVEYYGGNEYMVTILPLRKKEQEYNNPNKVVVISTDYPNNSM